MSRVMTKRRGCGHGHGHGRKNKRTMRRRRSHSAHLTRSRRHHRHGSRSRARRGGGGKGEAALKYAMKAFELGHSSHERNKAAAKAKAEEEEKGLKGISKTETTPSTARMFPRATASSHRPPTELSMAAKLSAPRMSAAAARAFMLSKSNMGE